MRFADPAAMAGWVVAAVWVTWLGACLARGWVAAGRRPGARCRWVTVWRAWSVRGRVLSLGLGVAVWLDVAQLQVVDSIEDRSGLSTVDPSITAWFVEHRGMVLTDAAKLVSDAGSTAAMGALTLLAVAWLAWCRRWSQARMVAVAALGAAGIGSVMKQVLDRPRPPRTDQLVVETTASLPSGHALGSTVVLGVLTAIAFGVIRRPVHRAALVMIIVVILAAVGLSRLYLGVHWATDVLTGWLLGAAWLSACVTILTVSRQPGASAGS